MSSGPVTYQSAYLKRKLYPAQVEICSAIDHHAAVSIAGCHASGKTYDIAGLVPYWLTRYSDGMVLTVAPTLRQVKTMWREISMASVAARYPLPEPQTTALEVSKDNYAQGFSAAKGVNAQGFHGKRGLLWVDEAPGIQAEVWEALDGILMGGDWKIICSGNPTIPSGRFFEDFGKRKTQVHGIRISAFDTPNLEGLTIEKILEMDEATLRRPVPFPGLATPWGVKAMYLKYGETSPQYQSRVLAQFPAQSRYSVFPAEAVQRAARPLTEAQLKELNPRFSGVIQVGIDVAGAGDDETAACARYGNVVIAYDAWTDADARGAVAVFLGNLKRRFPSARLVLVVDMVGIGYHFALWLASQGLDVRGFIANAKPLDQASFYDCKAEAYWALGEWMRSGIYGVEDQDTQAQLIGIQFRPMPTGEIRIEEKDEMKKRGLSSPDRAEALVMSFCLLVPLRQTVTYQDTGVRM